MTRTDIKGGLSVSAKGQVFRNSASVERPVRTVGPTRRQMKRFYPHATLSTRIIALPDLGLVYVTNAKAASSTMLLWLDRLHTGEHDFDSQRPHRDHRLPSVADVGWNVVSTMLGGAAFRFAFVRHPVRRLESAYHNKLGRPGKWRTKVQATLGLPQAADSPVSFEDFVSAIERQDPLTMDLHWRPQHLNLMHSLVTFDFIGRVETIDRDLATIRREVGLPGVPVESRAVTRRDTTESVYDGRPDLVKRVERIYATDFEIYHY